MRSKKVNNISPDVYCLKKLTSTIKLHTACCISTTTSRPFTLNLAFNGTLTQNSQRQKGKQQSKRLHSSDTDKEYHTKCDRSNYLFWQFLPVIIKLKKKKLVYKNKNVMISKQPTLSDLISFNDHHLFRPFKMTTTAQQNMFVHHSMLADQEYYADLAQQ